MMEHIGKTLIIIGCILALTGIIIILLNKVFDIHEFPGTIRIETERVKIFIPILASIILSLVLTLILNLIAHFINR